MKKLKTLGTALTKAEMKAVNGGFHRCDEGYVCGPPCPDPDNNPGQSMGWFCEGGIGGACKPMYCAV